MRRSGRAPLRSRRRREPVLGLEPVEELGDAGLEFVEVNYSKERLFEDIKDLYGELSHKKAQKAQMLPATGASLRRH